jgi:tripartite-type tricarboxylate transporter receptor subunit TctC
MPGTLVLQEKPPEDHVIALCLRVAAVAFVLLATASPGVADEPYYKGKRLTVMINYGAGGPADIEGRIFARHLG